MLSHTAYIPYLNVSSFLPALSPAHSGKYNSCRFHCSVEVTVLSTNKQHSLPVSRHRTRFQAHHKQVALVAQPDVEKFCAPLALSCRPIPDSVLRAQELAALPHTPVTPVLVVVVLRFPADSTTKVLVDMAALTTGHTHISLRLRSRTFFGSSPSIHRTRPRQQIDSCRSSH